MFQLWKLVLLCGLLSGASASLLAALNKDESGTVNRALDGDNVVVESTLDFALQALENITQDLEVSELIKNIAQKAEEFVNTADYNLFQLHVEELRVSDIKAEPSPEGEGLNVRIPINMNVSLTLPLIGKLVNLKVNLDLLLHYRIETDSDTGFSKLVMQKCATDPLSLELTLPNRPARFINRIVGSITDKMKHTVSKQVEGEVCPNMDIIFQNLTEKMLKGLMGQLQQNVQKNIPL